MSSSYTLNGSTVLHDGRDRLTYKEVREFMRFAIRRRLRARLHAQSFFENLKKHGSSDFEWSYTRSAKYDSHHWVGITALFDNGSYELRCDGPKAEYTVDRVCRAVARNESRNNKVRAYFKRCKKNRRKTKKAQKLLAAQVSRPKGPKLGKRRRNVPAAIELRTKQKVVPQFRSNIVFWTEAIKAVVDIFQVRDGWKYAAGRSDGWKHSATEIVARELHDSLKQNGGRMAQFKRRDFILRFDLTDGCWRGDLTPLTVSATKDNTHPTYRRMRKFFRARLGSLTGEARHRRQEVAEVAEIVHVDWLHPVQRAALQLVA